MICHSCKQPTITERNYCGACGVLLVQYCRACGFRNLSTDRFCGGCGGELAALPGVRTPQPSAGASDLSSSPASGAELQELLQLARAESTSDRDELSVRVSQNDIDHLFGD